jgi:hypothetical protein
MSQDRISDFELGLNRLLTLADHQWISEGIDFTMDDIPWDGRSQVRKALQPLVVLRYAECRGEQLPHGATSGGRLKIYRLRPNSIAELRARLCWML